MKIILLSVPDTTQAKLILKPGSAVIKIPSNIPETLQEEVRSKLMKIANLQKDNQMYLKSYYKIGEPYIFLNKKISARKRQTHITYVYADL